ncbi:MAG: GNAT family N-acetyltransferase [Treponema sp.]|jgi:ribosomal-protein-alanine N-acetyltransferase|nr:GNAT family N-acetyltransferase [Treponema sp.]
MNTFYIPLKCDNPYVMNKHYTLTFALPSDIDGIMAIEDSAFPQGIRESEETFLERLTLFPHGNTVLKEDATQRSEEKPIGYFCSELWDEIPPAEAKFYALGHSMKERHVHRGTILYISSLAVRPGAKGQGRFLFNESIKLLCVANPQIRSIILLVNELWLPARHIYETEGFRYTEVLKSFFTEHRGTQSDGLLMRKDL